MNPKRNLSIKVVMFPWLGHGHISPFLELAKKLSSRNFKIYICSTPANLNPIRNKLHDCTSNIELIEFSLPSLPQLPPHYHTTNGLPPHLMKTLTKAFVSASSKFSQIINSLSPDLVIYDICLPSVPKLAAAYQIPAVHFLTSGAATVSYMFRLLKNLQTPFPSTSVFLKDSELRKMAEAHPGEGQEDKDRVLDCIMDTKDILLIKSSRNIEGKYLDCLSKLINKKIVPVGPLVQDVHVHDQENDDEDVMKWLNKKDACSTVYVSFGTESYLSRKGVEELAYGLELSNLNFIWVLKFPGGDKALEVLPEGFLERTGDRSKVVEGWAPQAKILRHSSIAGFVSHCGWSSVMESLSFGVPVIAMPLQNDQPLNARLAVELGFGLEVEKDEKFEFGREEVARVVTQVVVDKGGENMRRKAQQLSEEMKVRGEREIDSAIKQLKTLVQNNRAM
ncbi:hypothetical protein ACET3Z_002184 [Daucus carota]